MTFEGFSYKGSYLRFDFSLQVILFNLVLWGGEAIKLVFVCFFSFKSSFYPVFK